MTDTDLILKLIEQQSQTISDLQRNFQILNDHSIEWVQGMTAVATKVDILMWLTGVILVVFIGLVVERLWASKKNGHNNSNNK